jgi:hypothetical protein
VQQLQGAIIDKVHAQVHTEFKKPLGGPRSQVKYNEQAKAQLQAETQCATAHVVAVCGEFRAPDLWVLYATPGRSVEVSPPALPLFSVVVPWDAFRCLSKGGLAVVWWRGPDGPRFLCCCCFGLLWYLGYRKPLGCASCFFTVLLLVSFIPLT